MLLLQKHKHMVCVHEFYNQPNVVIRVRRYRFADVFSVCVVMVPEPVKRARIYGHVHLIIIIQETIYI